MALTLFSSQYLGNLNENILDILDEEVLNIFSVILTDIFSRMSIIAFVVAILGIGLIVLGILLKPEEEKITEKKEN